VLVLVLVLVLEKAATWWREPGDQGSGMRGKT